MNEVEIVKGTKEMSRWKIVYEVLPWDYEDKVDVGIGIMRDGTYLWRDIIRHESFKDNPVTLDDKRLSELAVERIDHFLNSLCGEIDHIQIVKMQ